MSQERLSKDVTIVDLIERQSLTKIEDYLIAAIGHMETFKKEHGDVYLRIGVTGTGRSPHYRLEPHLDRRGAILDEYLPEAGRNEDRFAKYFVAFDGRSHKLMPLGMRELRGPNWSESFTDLATMKAQFASLRQARQFQKSSRKV